MDNQRIPNPTAVGVCLWRRNGVLAAVDHPQGKFGGVGPPDVINSIPVVFHGLG